MTKKWNTTKLMAAGSIAVIMTLFQLFGSAIQTITGFIGMGGIVNAIVTPVFLILCLLLLNQFGSGTLMLFIQSILILALPLTGTPGFFPKIFILTFGGFLADISYHLLKKYKLIFSIVTGGFIMLFIGFSMAEIGRLFQLPGIEEVINAFYSLLVFVAIFMGCIGGYLGYKIFQKIKSTSIVRRIQK